MDIAGVANHIDGTEVGPEVDRHAEVVLVKGRLLRPVTSWRLAAGCRVGEHDCGQQLTGLPLTGQPPRKLGFEDGRVHAGQVAPGDRRVIALPAQTAHPGSSEEPLRRAQVGLAMDGAEVLGLLGQREDLRVAVQQAQEQGGPGLGVTANEQRPPGHRREVIVLAR